ncbi:MAG: hypothetical protein KKF44_04630 [Nanoarchaeota archaeon]|nr:hypothetical protein [Nanoarchaeota archaeon]
MRKKQLNLAFVMLFISAFTLGILVTLLAIDNFSVRDEASYTPTAYSTFVLENDDIKEIDAAPEEKNKDSRLLQLLGLSNEEQASPHDWIKQSQIHVEKDRVVIDIKNAEWAMFTDTNSMDPVIDEDSHAIEIVPESPGDIHVGDIVSYDSKFSDGTIIHRVVRIGFDETGWYCIMKGDNNRDEDPGKVRFPQIKRVLVGILY